MRKVARGRIVPQSRSTDPRIGRVSLKAAILYDRMWINADDQGRLSGDPDEIKYIACPNLPSILKDDIPSLLKELADIKPGLILLYPTSKTEAIQMIDWWEEQKLQWASPSSNPPPEGWTDHVRYHLTPKEIITENWPPSGLPASEVLPSTLPSNPATPEGLGREIRSTLMALPETLDRRAEHELMKETLAKLGQGKGFSPKREVGIEEGRLDLWWEDPAGKVIAAFEIDVYEARKRSVTKLKALGCPYQFIILRTNPEPLQWHQNILLIGLSKERESSKEKVIDKDKEEDKEEEEGRVPSTLASLLPSALASTASPSLLTDIPLFDYLLAVFPAAFGRKPNSRETAQLRDLEKEISSAGGASAQQVYDAYKEACGHNKFSVSYVRAILLDWLGVKR